MNDWCEANIAELGAVIRRGELTALELVERFQARIEQVDRTLNAYITVCADRARSEACKADEMLAAGEDQGPLHGIPYAVKDTFATAGVRTTANCRLLENWIPAIDGPAIARLRDAGAVLLGKLTMNELEFGGYELAPCARNPLLLGRSAGGSSSGSGSAVAGNLAVFALGADGGGSIRIPAANCGLVGLAPTPGRIDGSGVLGSTRLPRIRRIGPLTRCVADARAVEAVLAANAPAQSLTGRVRFGRLSRHEEEIGLDPDVRRCIDTAIAACSGYGEIVDVEIEDFSESSLVNWTFLAAWAASQYASLCAAAPDRVTPELLGLLDRGRAITSEQMRQAQDFRKRFTDAVDRVLKDVDVLICPTRPNAQNADEHEDFRHQRSHGNAKCFFVAPFNLSGHPALTIPCGRSESGSGIGLQLVAAPDRDHLLLEVAQWIEMSLTLTAQPAFVH